jgi:hypothetical protein
MEIDMYADELVYPLLKSVKRGKGNVRFPKTIAISGESLAPWLRKRLGLALKCLGITERQSASATIRVERTSLSRKGDDRTATAKQAYELSLDSEGSVRIRGASEAALQHGGITLCHLLEARVAGAKLSPLEIRDEPAFEVRGLHVDMAREFFPDLRYLRKLLDRMADLKFNTVWLYLENHFRAPGLEDISQKNGLTPEQAREISEYGAERGIDVVPATNVLSHMEGWLRLERYSDFTDGAMRSYPILTEKSVWPLVRKYLDELIAAFPSENIHPGLDELLFTGTNPEAARIIEKTGKVAYFADFAEKVIRHLQSKGKRVWIWDDMVLGKNIDRKEGFQAEYRKALDRIDPNVVMTHWYYWDNKDGMHTAIFDRVAKSGRPVAMAPCAAAHGSDFGSFSETVKVQRYMASRGQECGAFGFVNTHWECQYGNSYEANWPCNAVSAGFAWSGGDGKFDAKAETAFSYVVTGDTKGALCRFHENIDEILACIGGGSKLRYSLIRRGPHFLWRDRTGVIVPEKRQKLRRMLTKAEETLSRLGNRDRELNQALGLHLVLTRESIAILDAFDQAWGEYHRAALIEREPKRKAEFNRRIQNTMACLNDVESATKRYANALQNLSKQTGHTPYDVHALKQWAKLIHGVQKLILDVARDGNGLPYFEKLLNLPDAYANSNLLKIQVCNGFDAWYGQGRDTAPPPRHEKIE